MKLVHITLLSFSLTACILQSANLVLSEPGDSSEVSSVSGRHQFSISQDRMLIHNGEEELYVPDNKEVVVRIAEEGEPSFSLRDN